MSATVAAPAGGMTVEAFLDWAGRQSDARFELVDGVPLRMSPESNRHLLVKGAVFECFRQAVRSAGIACRVLPEGGTVAIGDFKAREPDVSVVCDVDLDLDSTLVGAPIVVVEITSPSTMRIDTHDKLIEYFSLPGVRHYLLVHPVDRAIVHHRRAEGGRIETSIAYDGTLHFDPPGFSVEIARFFEDLPSGIAH